MSYCYWTIGELEILLDNFDTPTIKLMKFFPHRTQKSVERKIEYLRECGLLGYRSEETVQTAYMLRNK